MFNVFVDDVSSMRSEETGAVPGLRESGPEWLQYDPGDTTENCGEDAWHERSR